MKLIYYGLLLALLPFISLYIIPFIVLKKTIISAETTSLLGPVILLDFLNELYYEKVYIRKIKPKYLKLLYFVSIGIAFIDGLEEVFQDEGKLQ